MRKNGPIHTLAELSIDTPDVKVLDLIARQLRIDQPAKNFRMNVTAILHAVGYEELGVEAKVA